MNFFYFAIKIWNFLLPQKKYFFWNESKIILVGKANIKINPCSLVWLNIKVPLIFLWKAFSAHCNYLLSTVSHFIQMQKTHGIFGYLIFTPLSEWAVCQTEYTIRELILFSMYFYFLLLVHQHFINEYKLNRIWN